MGISLCLGCEPLPCLERVNVRLKIAFFQETSDAVRSARFPSSQLVFSDPQHTYTKSSAGLSSIPDSTLDILLPLSGQAGLYTLVLGDSALADTLEFVLGSRLKFQNQSCGYFPVYRLENAVHQGGKRIKRIELKEPSIDQVQKTNVEVFF